MAYVGYVEIYKRWSRILKPDAWICITKKIINQIALKLRINTDGQFYFDGLLIWLNFCMDFRAVSKRKKKVFSGLVSFIGTSAEFIFEQTKGV
jgi:hypothetical protein